MPAGLEIYDASGNLFLGLDTKLMKIVGEISVGGAGFPQSGSLIHDIFTQGRPDYIIVPYGMDDPEGQSVTVSIVGNTLYWTFPSASSDAWRRPYARIIYGAY